MRKAVKLGYPYESFMVGFLFFLCEKNSVSSELNLTSVQLHLCWKSEGHVHGSVFLDLPHRQLGEF